MKIPIRRIDPHDRMWHGPRQFAAFGLMIALLVINYAGANGYLPSWPTWTPWITVPLVPVAGLLFWYKPRIVKGRP